MNEQTKQAAQTIGRLKRKASDEEQLQGWRETCAEQGLSGEFILTTKLNGAAYTEEEARMVAELFGK
ncbi:hypothetical protein QP713_03770 [Neisseria mucosa]|jgi:hypothetical protein|uniref:Uncharacterized protein n=1 Tax=Neisseria mucosa TaxID=488 RepID=A0AAW6ZEV4_NEIMU|nr:hypothetical protein [Neisseria mucosa]KJJ13394.1 hypothetical protein HMPREF3156_02317 [Neisseria sp. HMSC06F02]MDU4437122.1 hypothetical protein [Neisseria sp.]OFR06011.1 hypothetical protein HMPREF2907_04565 [Neisseria sp. HMSC055H02]OFS02888.1 hypothetical protein HMPREF2954_04815 [Neisseria sp. HMSC067H09]AVR79198.1 hypothetical protein NM96_07535 [Neisseria mucosa]